MTFLKRLAPESAGSVVRCYGTAGCPDIWQLDDGDFAVIGADITQHASELPPSAGCAPHERMVKIPRRLLVQAKAHIPDTV